MNEINKYLDHVLEQIQSPTEEREEIREELLSHLTEAKIHYMAEGLSDKKAEKKAINDFGEARNIGKRLQEAMYPYQRSLLYIIGVATIVYGLLFYLSAAFNLQEVIPGWLAIQFTFGGVLTLFALNISLLGRRLYLLHILIILTMMWTGFNLMMVETVPFYGHNIFFTIYLVILMMIGLLFLFRNSYYSTDIPKSKSRNDRILIVASYIINLIYGIILIGFSMFFLWVALIFGGIAWTIIIPLIPVLAWLVFYKFQMRLIAKKPVISLFTGFLFLILPLSIIYLI